MEIPILKTAVKIVIDGIPFLKALFSEFEAWSAVQASGGHEAARCEDRRFRGVRLQLDRQAQVRSIRDGAEAWTTLYCNCIHPEPRQNPRRRSHVQQEPGSMHTRTGGPWGFDESSVWLCACRCSHIGGLGWVLVGLANGAGVVLPEFPPDGLLEVMEGG